MELVENSTVQWQQSWMYFPLKGSANEVSCPSAKIGRRDAAGKPVQMKLRKIGEMINPRIPVQSFAQAHDSGWRTSHPGCRATDCVDRLPELSFARIRYRNGECG